MVSVPSITFFTPLMSLLNSLDAERSHTSLVLGSTMRCLYSIMLPVMGFNMALMYSLLAISDKGYNLLWSGIYIVLTSSLIMIAWTFSALNRVGYLCVLSFRFQLSVWIGGPIYSWTSSTLIPSIALRDSTLGGGSLTLRSLVVLGLSDVGSAVVLWLHLIILQIFPWVLSRCCNLRVQKVVWDVDDFMPKIIPIPPLLLCCLIIMLEYCIFWGRISLHHTHVFLVFL